VKVIANGLQRSSQQITFRQYRLGFPADAAGTANYASHVQPVSLIVLCTSCDQCKCVVRQDSRDGDVSSVVETVTFWSRDAVSPITFYGMTPPATSHLCALSASSWLQQTHTVKMWHGLLTFGHRSSSI